MKKFMSFLLCIVFVFSFCACKNINDDEILGSREEKIIFSEEDANKITELIDEFANVEAENLKQQDVRKYLEQYDWVEKISETADGGVSCVTTFGVPIVWTPEEDNKIGNSNNDTNTISIDNSTMSMIDTINTYDVDSVAILCPYASVDSRFNLDGYNFIGETMDKYTDCEVAFFKDEEVSLELLKGLDEFDMVWFYSHGALSNVFNSAWAIVDSDPYTMTGEFANSANAYMLLSNDFYYGRTVVNLSDGRIGVGGRFYEHYYSDNQMDGMFFHFASCNSMRTDKLANGILSRGAEWVEGWDNSVNFDNDYMQFVGVIANLLEGDNIKQAIIDADELVKNEYDFYQEDCKLRGLGDDNYSLKIIQDSHNTVESYIPVISDEISEFAYDNNAGSCFLYDMDNDNIDELVVLGVYSRIDGNDFPGHGYSVYDIENGKVVVKCDRKLLFFDAGGPSGYVGVANYKGKTVLLVSTDNGETGYGANRESVFTIYDTSTFNEIFTATTNYTSLEERKIRGCTINGESCDYAEYRSFVDSVEKIITTEIYDNDNTDGSMTLYELLYEIQNDANIKATEPDVIGNAKAEKTANILWGEYFERDQGFDWRIFKENSLIKDGIEFYCYTLRSNMLHKNVWSISEYLFINSVTGEYSSCLFSLNFETPVVYVSNGSHNDKWKSLYTDYLNSIDENTYDDIALVAIDNDSIPEMYICGKYAVAGAVFCWIDNGELKTQRCGQAFGYKANTGKFYAFSLQMGVSRLTEYTLKNGKLTTDDIASGSEANNSYKWQGEEISLEKYWDNQWKYTEAYDFPSFMSLKDAIATIASYP